MELLMAIVRLLTKVGGFELVPAGNGKLAIPTSHGAIVGLERVRLVHDAPVRIELWGSMVSNKVDALLTWGADENMVQINVRDATAEALVLAYEDMVR
jgi:hypothetical protein